MLDGCLIFSSQSPHIFYNISEEEESHELFVVYIEVLSILQPIH